MNDDDNCLIRSYGGSVKIEIDDNKMKGRKVRITRVYHNHDRSDNNGY